MRAAVSIPRSPTDDAVGSYRTELEISGAREVYVGDTHVWCWYRGTGVGPYPCLSALQALERVLDQLIETGIPIGRLVPILLDGCHNLAMIGLVVGLLVRHLENADHLLAPYLAEPLIWHQEFGRVVSESGGFAADSDGLVAPDRRKWSLREAAMFMVVRADGERASELRALGEQLVTNARHQIESMRDDEQVEAAVGTIDQQLATVHVWASCLDRDKYEAHDTPGGLYVQAKPPDAVVRALQHSNENLERGREAARLFVRYEIEVKEKGADTIQPDELAADLATARSLLENPPSSRGLEEPVAESLANIADSSILPSRLDAAIRALAPAAMANICVSARARELLLTLLATQRRALLSQERGSGPSRLSLPGLRTLSVDAGRTWR